MNKYLELFIETKNDYYQSIEDSFLLEYIKYIMDSNGKVLRPSLLLTSCNYFNINLDDVRYLSLMIEMIHTYSLIHDDLPCMDNDDYRRGKLTLHKKYTEGIAVLTGDSLLSDAFGLIDRVNIDDSIKVKLVSLLSNCIGSNGMVDGQLYDIGDCLNDVDSIIRMFIKKTGKLFAFAISAPLVILNDERFSLYYKLGELLGVCFQLKDDIDEYSQSNVESLIINQIGLDKVYDLFNDYRCKVDNLVECLKINKESDLYQLIIKIRG